MYYQATDLLVPLFMRSGGQPNRMYPNMHVIMGIYDIPSTCVCSGGPAALRAKNNICLRGPPPAGGIFHLFLRPPHSEILPISGYPGYLGIPSNRS